MNERRRSRRFGLALPVKARFPYPIDRPTCNGNTRDISTTGVYFLCSEDGIDVGADLDLEITLPGTVTGGNDVVVRAIGKAVRVEDVSEQIAGVAVMISAFEIVRQEASAVAG